MTTYIAILRGINVSGQKRIKMDNLREALASLGFSDLATYIQSGNIIFKSETENCQILQLKINQRIKKGFGFDVPVIIRTLEEWQFMVEQNPFQNQKHIDENKLHATFLEEVPVINLGEEMDASMYLPDEFVLRDKTIYVHCPNGYGKTKLNNMFFENKLKTPATTRNWKTTLKLLAMAKAI